MPINSKRKGKHGELELSHKLAELFGVQARRGQQFSGANGDADVVGLPGVHCEVKRTETLRLWPAINQAVADAKDDAVPVVFHRPNRREWVAVLRLADLPRLSAVLFHVLSSEGE